MTLSIKVCFTRQDFILDVAVDLPLDGVTALFGRSGCGKTTLLRVIAGLERVPDATVVFGHEVWQQGRCFLPLHQRRIGLVFQEHSLLPHLSVRGNLEYGYRRTPAALRRLELIDVVNMLDIGDLLDRSVDRLSGGQCQRIALGRALLSSPNLLLLDEPLAALDTQSKREIMPFLSRLTQQTGVPIILITHAPDEVEQLADHVVFMRQGLIERMETLREAIARPDSPLFDDAGPVAVLEGELKATDERGLQAFESESVCLLLASAGQQPGSRKRLRVLARDVSLALDEPKRLSILNHLPVIIERIDPESVGRVTLACRLTDGQLLLAQITPWSLQQLGLTTGQHVYALIKSVALLE
ncbi:Molybdenum ABC transporter ATP-binding protein ModC [hydrothermal vent metagenome]|uniref:Molybdenum ABC transporter ATP-binding protein ModC n=1 Tax=hydrothermal vent metagenome TaxID=652676 RepID=A0A3B0ZEI5_9ZZZZ